MSELSYMEKLLDGVEIEWKKLGEVCEFQRGQSITKKKVVEGEVPVIAGGQQPAYYHNMSNRTGRTISVSGSGAYAGFVAFWEVPIFLSDAFSVSPNDQLLNSKYVFYFLKNLQNEIYNKKSGSGVPHVYGKDLYGFEIPIPPLNVQAEIVRILDAFTELTAELTAELVSRQQQYAYYRDELLTFNEGEAEWRTLDELVSFRRGSFPQPYGNSSWYDGESSMPFVQVADVSDFGFCLNKNTKQRISKLAQPKSVFVDKGTVIVSLQGTIGRVAVTQYDCYVDRTLAIFTNYKEQINKKYFAYQLKHKFDVEKEHARGSTLKTITKAEFSKFEIPVPPLAEQERIVTILDKFDALTTSLTEGLPREIELRQQQYEYYRELLLSFPKIEVATHD